MKLDQDPQVKKRLEDLKNALLAQEFSKRFIEDKVTISDEEVKAYYEKHKDQFTQREQVKARHILVKVPAGANEDAWKKAKKKALDIKARAEKGEDFAKLAKEFSDDPGTKDRGGELGYFGKGRMVPEFEKVAFSLEPGVISDPVKTIFGWHLIQVEDKKAAQVKPLEDVKSFVRQRALQEKKREMLEKLLADVEKKYSVKINKEVLDEIKIEPPRSSGMGGPHGFHGGGHGMPRGH
nr:peptidylprolyl isomerase [Dissulfuribacter thermophilus]